MNTMRCGPKVYKGRQVCRMQEDLSPVYADCYVTHRIVVVTLLPIRYSSSSTLNWPCWFVIREFYEDIRS